MFILNWGCAYTSTDYCPATPIELYRVKEDLLSTWARLAPLIKQADLSAYQPPQISQERSNYWPGRGYPYPDDGRLWITKSRFAKLSNRRRGTYASKGSPAMPRNECAM